MANCARSPTGTIRSLLPFPNIRNIPFCFCTFSTSNCTNSETRRPELYSNSKIALLRSCRGSSPAKKSSKNAVISTSLMTVGNLFSFLGVESKSAGLCSNIPSRWRNLQKLFRVDVFRLNVVFFNCCFCCRLAI